MAIKREDFDVGGTVMVVTRMGNGAAVQLRRRRAKVLDVNRAACQLQWCDDAKASPVTIPFTQLEADPEWLDLREQKRAERARRLESEKRSSLTYSLGEKLAQEEAPAEGASEAARQEALCAIEALRARDSAPPPAPKDEQRESDGDGGERREDTGVVHAPEPAPAPSEAPALQRAPAQSIDSMQLPALQREIDRLEEEQRALLDMLVPIEERLGALKRRRKVLSDPRRTATTFRPRTGLARAAGAVR